MWNRRGSSLAEEDKMLYLAEDVLLEIKQQFREPLPEVGNAECDSNEMLK